MSYNPINVTFDKVIITDYIVRLHIAIFRDMIVMYLTCHPIVAEVSYGVNVLWHVLFWVS